MQNKVQGIAWRDIAVANSKLGTKIEGRVFTGGGPQVVKAVAKHAGLDSLDVLDSIVDRLLVSKGADWTAVILSEYLGLYDDSQGTFALVWDNLTKQLVSHGSIFQSARHPWAALLAHIRTLDGFKGLGLGTLVTEEVTGAAIEQGAGLVVLATDDKINRVQQGERAAHSMYSRLGYAILGETRLADTIDWLMAINAPLLEASQKHRQANDGRLANADTDAVLSAKQQFITAIRHHFAGEANNNISAGEANSIVSVSEANSIISVGEANSIACSGDANRENSTELAATTISPGDLAGLFVLLNLCPPDDYRLKLTAWQIHHGPELERTFITTLRQAIVDQDRLQDASLVLRDSAGTLLAVCAAQQVAPFTRQTYAIDFYALPQFVQNNRLAIENLIQQTLDRIKQSPDVVRPCEILFTGIDAAKVQLFESLGFVRGDGKVRYHDSGGGVPIDAGRYVRSID